MRNALFLNFDFYSATRVTSYSCAAFTGRKDAKSSQFDATIFCKLFGYGVKKNCHDHVNITQRQSRIGVYKSLYQLRSDHNTHPHSEAKF